eukprot:scaffold1438_cov63-Cylindrotheca_fusiformis.AAC.2
MSEDRVLRRGLVRSNLNFYNSGLTRHTPSQLGYIPEWLKYACKGALVAAATNFGHECPTEI